MHLFIMGRRYTPILNRIDFQIVVSLWKTGLAFATSWSFSIEILNNLYELSTLSASVPNGTIFLWFMITSVYPDSCTYFKLIFFIQKFHSLRWVIWQFCFCRSVGFVCRGKSKCAKCVAG